MKKIWIMSKKIVVTGLVIIMLSVIFTGCTSNDYEETLKSGIDKYNNGEEMTQEEYDAVKDFNEWADEQGEKTYDEWDN